MNLKKNIKDIIKITDEIEQSKIHLHNLEIKKKVLTNLIINNDNLLKNKKFSYNDTRFIIKVDKIKNDIKIKKIKYYKC